MIARTFKLMFKALGVATPLAALLLGVLWIAFPFPQDRLNQWAISPRVLDSRGRPMMSIVSSDDTRRIPIALQDMSPWLVQASIAVEDKRFHRYIGVDPLAVCRALLQNIVSGRIVSGASTLDMQICRMMADRDRTFQAKAIESFRALQLNRLKSKHEILELYLNIAPYGGNIYGVQAAAQAYFYKHARDLNLPEAALIAGLPQSPSRYRPNAYLQRARQRQAQVLQAMFEQKMISRRQLEEAKAFQIVIKRKMHRAQAVHAAWLALQQRPLGGTTTIDLDTQETVEHFAQQHLNALPGDTEVAVVVIDINDAAIAAMLGSGNPQDHRDGLVNGATAKRSPGSTLKPFIYATAFAAHRLNTDSLVYDIPIHRRAWEPFNFDRQFRGPVTVGQALRHSLNIPAILVAEAVGISRCCGVLESAGVRLPSDAQQRGGLGLAVGGIEVSLLDLTNAYATLGRRGVRCNARLYPDEPGQACRVLRADVCSSINNVLSNRERNISSGTITSSPWCMWKTGTSAGRRDAWAVGHNHRYAIGVWIGRFRGTGRPEYTGATAAEPLLTRLFSHPQFSNPREPAPAPALTVHRPLPSPLERQHNLQITTPSNGETFVAVNEQASVHMTANQDNGLTWFLNGQCVGQGQDRWMDLGPGHYRLNCIAPTGSSSSVVFAIRPAVTLN